MRHVMAQAGAFWVRLGHSMNLLQLLRARSKRHHAGWMVVSMLVFQQLALAAYACPVFDSHRSAAPTELAMDDCADMAMGSVALDPQAPALCSQDCQDSHALRSPEVAQQVSLPIGWAMYIVPADRLLIPGDNFSDHSIPAAHADPPFTQRFCRLLI